MAQYPNSIATLSAVGNRTVFGTTLVRSWVTEMIAVQSDYNNVRGSASNLATFLNTARKPDGSFKLFQATHGVLQGVTANQHHNTIHGTRHRTSDAIRLSKAGATYQTGLMTTTMFESVNSWSSNATRTFASSGLVEGDGGNGKNYNIGFYPDFVQVQFSNISFTAWRASSPTTDQIHHASVNAVSNKSHIFTSGASGITIQSYGFHVREWLDNAGRDGYFFAIRRPEP